MTQQKTKKDDDKPYPTNYEDVEPITDADTWLKSREPSEVAEDAEKLHAYQLEWLLYVCENQNKMAMLRAELGQRDEDDYYTGNYQQNSSSKSSSSSSGTAEVWDSGLEVIDSFNDLTKHLIGAKSLEQYAKQELDVEKNKVIVPENVRKTLVSVQNQVNAEYGNRCEFGVLFKGEWTDEGFKVYNDYVIPEQTASRAHIKYTEDLKKYRDEGYIVNVHSHPWAGKTASFSGTDDDHVNSHFNVALLFGGKAETVVGGIANVEAEDGVQIQIKPEIKVEEPEEELPDVDIENVETRKRKTTSSKKKKKKTGNKRAWRSRKTAKGFYGDESRYRSKQEKYELPESPEETEDEQETWEKYLEGHPHY